ncbi:16S rRNA pseudouridine516 synthase [Rubritalea squalenifaciens DSM 18772]|uniref:Pseudouridine synthase n=2 Tax=Rubritalea TaxID=361050 RepID=A0A1M6I4T4_9BACT|nr:pseudouridine synthase [Rubritalea squalenifaciens]SHJ29432.1 16S rRNA pseudouridine516 synthase [Rubritalea squalenifaciens DSM 18772]
MRLDRFLTARTRLSRKEVQRLLAAGSVLVDDEVQMNTRHEVKQFTKVVVNGECLQDKKPVYIMLNKPAGYLSATKDDKHPTVMELIPEELHEGLHVAGRLDRASTGLLLLTNDGTWSRAITMPSSKITKTYLVRLRNPVSPSTQETFRNGIYFAYEDKTTLPTHFDIIEPTLVRIYLREGRYHQIKRMFFAVGNKVTSLHRESVGHHQLNDLQAGEFRLLTACDL